MVPALHVISPLGPFNCNEAEMPLLCFASYISLPVLLSLYFFFVVVVNIGNHVHFKSQALVVFMGHSIFRCAFGKVLFATFCSLLHHHLSALLTVSEESHLIVAINLCITSLVHKFSFFKKTRKVSPFP